MKIDIFDVQSFKDAVNSNEKLAVYFFSDWAAPSRAMNNVVNGVYDKLNGRLSFGAVDANENKELLMIFGIKSLPAVLVFEKGRVTEAIEGYQPLVTLLKALEKYAA